MKGKELKKAEDFDEMDDDDDDVFDELEDADDVEVEDAKAGASAPSLPADLDEAKPLGEHLEELRVRIGIVVAAIVVLSIFSYFFVDKIVAMMAGPAGGFVFLRPAEAFMARLKIALIGGVLLTIPIMIYEIWRFVGVALTPAESKVTLRVLPISYLLFCLGAACAWFVVLPAAVHFLLGFATESLQAYISIDAYISFAAWLVVAFGLMFQLPIVVFFLVKVGIATPASLSRYRRHVILGLAIMAAFLTPGPDLFSQLALLIPTWLLYEISVLVARVTMSPEEPEKGSDT